MFLALGIVCLPPLAGAVPLRASSQEPPVAFPVEFGRETRRTRVEAPRSKLKPAAALAAANAVAAQVPGAEVFTVLPTGSMRPMFNERAFLVSEPVNYADLEVGDIITYWHPKRLRPIVHRILEKRGAGFWTKGDFNDRPDDVYVTQKSRIMRVFAIIYAREDGNAVATTQVAASAGS